jgi:hypothetical protein
MVAFLFAGHDQTTESLQMRKKECEKEQSALNGLEPTDVYLILHAA